MRFRTKLLAAFAALVIATNVVSLWVLRSQAHADVMGEVRTQALSIAITAAPAIDGDLHRQIKTAGDRETQAYRTIQKQLQRIRDDNRRDDIHVENVYTLMPLANDSDVLVFGVDSETDPTELSQVGEVYHFKNNRSIRVDVPDVDETFTEDQWGTWIIANAPIVDSSGEVVAALAIDLPAERVENMVSARLYQDGTILAVSTAMACLIALGLSRFVTRPLSRLQTAIEAIGRGDLDTQVHVASSDEFHELGESINEMTRGLQERHALKHSFARYVSHQVMNHILTTGELPSPTGERRRITVLFADIRGFTTLAEQLPPEEIVSMLNEYFGRMIDVIFRHHGTLDKFIGDGIMAIFGAPVDDAHQEENAVRAGLEMQHEAAALREKWGAEGKPPMSIGVGINSGLAIVGNVGSDQRMEYTAIGDTVNLAARLESATRQHEVGVLVSEYTYVAARPMFSFRHVGPVTVKGKAEPVNAYTVTGLDAVTETSNEPAEVA